MRINGRRRFKVGQVSDLPWEGRTAGQAQAGQVKDQPYGK